VKQLKPTRFIVPMHYAVPKYEDLLGPDEFLLGLKNVKRTLANERAGNPLDTKPPDAPTVVLLGWKKAGAVPPKKQPIPPFRPRRGVFERSAP